MLADVVSAVGAEFEDMAGVLRVEYAEEYARQVQRAVLDATRLHCSVGIGDNKLRAKIATEFGISRNHLIKVVRDRIIEGMLLAAGLVAVFTTLAIVAILLIESSAFFEHVSLVEFLTGDVLGKAAWLWLVWAMSFGFAISLLVVVAAVYGYMALQPTIRQAQVRNAAPGAGGRARRVGARVGRVAPVPRGAGERRHRRPAPQAGVGALHQLPVRAGLNPQDQKSTLE